MLKDRRLLLFRHPVRHARGKVLVTNMRFPIV
jgi:hypothetical protein